MKQYAWLAIVLLAFAAGLAWLMMQPLDAITRLSRENGPIEAASAIGFAFCALAVWARGGTSALTKALVSVLLLVMAAREMDFDKRFFTRGLFKSSQYLKSDVPFAEKVVGGLILLVIIGCLIGLILRERRTLWTGLRTGAVGAMALVVTVLFAGIAKSLDGIARKLAPFGIEVGEALSARLQGVEELMELAIMALLLVAILGPWRRIGGTDTAL